MIASSPLRQRMEMTVDEFLAAHLPEGYQYELVDGEVIVSCNPELPHERVVFLLSRLFNQYMDRRPDLVAFLCTRARVVLVPRRTARSPDFAVYASSPAGTEDARSWKNFEPLLVVEVVSDDYADVDYVEKRRDYWEAGVPEYWIADRGRGTITVLRRGEQDWHEMVFSRGEIYSPQAFPGMDVDVATILGH